MENQTAEGAINITLTHSSCFISLLTVISCQLNDFIGGTNNNSEVPTACISNMVNYGWSEMSKQLQ